MLDVQQGDSTAVLVKTHQQPSRLQHPVPGHLKFVPDPQVPSGESARCFGKGAKVSLSKLMIPDIPVLFLSSSSRGSVRQRANLLEKYPVPVLIWHLCPGAVTNHLAWKARPRLILLGDRPLSM